MNETKFCKNCAHMDLRGLCKKTAHVEVVFGKTQMFSCLASRDMNELCGKEAKWFEPADNYVAIP